MKKFIVLASIMLMGLSSSVYALTTANTSITNTAVLSYSVGASPQTDINASDAGFVVDRKIDVIIASTDASKTLNVTPGSVNQALTFQIANSGNDGETYDLTVDSTIATDNFDPTSCQIFDTANPAVAITSITLAQETNATLEVRCTIPVAAPAVGGVNDGDLGTIVLNAAINGRADNTADADDPAVVQNVYADGAGANVAGTIDAANDGSHSDQGTYRVVSPDLSMVKSSIVVSDPVNTASGGTTPHRIPGAVVRYCFTVDNNGSTDASSVVIGDDFSADGKANLTYVNSGFITQSNTVACDCAAIADTSGSITGTDVSIVIGTITSAAPTARACAYIEATID